jgi:hypothetical protein
MAKESLEAGGQPRAFLSYETPIGGERISLSSNSLAISLQSNSVTISL